MGGTYSARIFRPVMFNAVLIHCLQNGVRDDRAFAPFGQVLCDFPQIKTDFSLAGTLS